MGRQPIFRLEMSYQIRHYLQQNHLSQRAFARKCKIALSTVQRIVKNEGRVKAETAKRIAEGIGCTLGDLAGPPSDEGFETFLQQLLETLPNDLSSSPYLLECCKREPERACLYLLWIADAVGLPDDIKWKDIQSWINRSFYEVPNPSLPLDTVSSERTEQALAFAHA